MHTFDIGQAISGGFSAFGKKAVPLILITLVGGLLSILVSVLIIGNPFSGMTTANIDEDGNIQAEGRINEGLNNYLDILQDPTSYEGNEEDLARDIAEGFGLDFDQIQDITADGEVTNSEALRTYRGSDLSPFGDVSFGRIILGSIVSAIIGLLFGLALLTTSLDAVMGRPFSTDNITKNFSKIPAFIVFGIVVFLLSLLNIIPLLGFIIYLIIYLMIIQAPFIIVEEGKGAIEAMKRSNELMKGNKLRFFGLLLIVGIVGAILGTITLGIGYLVIVPVMACIFSHVYKQLSQGPVAATANKVKEAVS